MIDLIYCYISPLVCHLHEDRDFCLFWSLPWLQYLVQWLAQRRSSINICELTRDEGCCATYYIPDVSQPLFYFLLEIHVVISFLIFEKSVCNTQHAAPYSGEGVTGRPLEFCGRWWPSTCRKKTEVHSAKVHFSQGGGISSYFNFLPSSKKELSSFLLSCILWFFYNDNRMTL